MAFPIRKRPCVSFTDSLNTLRINDNGAQFGLSLPDNACTYKWKAWQRDGWIRALQTAEMTVRRELGSPICPKEICDEVHHVGEKLNLRHVPVAYLGKRVFGDYQAANVVYDDDEHTTAVVDLCVSDVPSLTEFSDATAVSACAVVGGQPNQLDLTAANLQLLGEVVAGVEYLVTFTDATTILAETISYNAATGVLRLDFGTAVDCSYGGGAATVKRRFADFDPDFSFDNLEWDYPEVLATYYRGAQILQEPIGPVDIEDCGLSSPYTPTGCAIVGGQPNQLDLTIADLEVAWGTVAVGTVFTVNLLDGTETTATAVAYNTGTDVLRLDFGEAVNCSFGTGVSDVVRHLELVGYQFTWPGFQMSDPRVDETQADEDENFLTAVRWRYSTVDVSQAYEFVGECSCSVCVSGNPSLTLELEDATEGRVCITQCRCVGRGRRIRLNYATAFECSQDSVDADLKEAVVYIALTTAGHTEAKPCGCDNTLIDWLLSEDPVADRAFATQVRFDGSRAGMKAQRIIDQILNRPLPDRDIESAGMGRVRSSGFWR